ncbi:E3 ubiquitin-protein ligase KCMF1 [Drosophila guanche]|uniref:RING-type E3 ubiquitin transferase n=1 Tax=Drosophila guanche TaxID=7266 RepID=A0A3B0K763_DROGU|nr:E3 ubiquitin-protein ligase KCMF1 [Drosophila guanche]SPP88512.1 blast:E3 ubiquitin-protein ligase KCMF1 [Drosophila guanche]
MATHASICCDGCGNGNLLGYRFKCLKCADYDLCRTCYDRKVVTLNHHWGHAMQCLLDEDAKRLHFAGEPMPVLNAESFTCPVCGAMGHSEVDLVQHVDEEHRNFSGLVICPLCMAVPSADPDLLRNIWQHFRNLHRSTPSVLVNVGRIAREVGTEQSPIAGPSSFWGPYCAHATAQPLAPLAQPIRFIDDSSDEDDA